MMNVNRPHYLFIRFLLKNVLHAVFCIKGYRIYGRENLPVRRKSAILIANHAAFIDSVYLICSLRPRFVICGAKPKYFQKWMIRQLFFIANIMKVENHDQFLKDCGQLLQNNELILIYPEMGRFPEGPGPFKKWAAEVALSNRVPVIPCYLYGTTGGQSGKKCLTVGPAITAEGDPEALTQLFRKSIIDLNPHP